MAAAAADHGGMRARMRGAPWLPVAAWILAVAGVAVMVAVSSLTPIELVSALFVLSLPTVGALIALCRPDNPRPLISVGSDAARAGCPP